MPDLFGAFFDLSLTGGIVFEPILDAAGQVSDFTYQRLNPVAQRLLNLPAQPTETFLTRYPHALTTGIFAFYRDAFVTGEARQAEFNYQYDGLDNYFHLAAQRVGPQLLVSFTDTSEQPRTAVEQALRESQAAERDARATAEHERALLHRILRQVPAYVATFEGPAHVYSFFNEEFGRVLTQGRAQLGQPFAAVFPELVEQGYLAMLDQVYASGQEFALTEAAVRHRDPATGHERTNYLNVVYQPLRDEQGQLHSLLGFATDVTEQVLARQQLQQLNQELEDRVQQRTQEAEVARAQAEREQAFFYQVLSQAPAYIATFDGPTHVYSFVNEAFKQVLTQGRAQVGQAFADLFPELVTQGFLAVLDQVYTSGQAFAIPEARVVQHDPATGQPRTVYVNTTYQPLRNSHGQVSGLLAFATDVTEQVLARQQVEAGAQRLRLLTDALPVLIGYLDRARRYQFTNQAYEAWFNQPADALLGREVREVVGETAYQATAGYMDRALAGERLEFTTQLTYREGFTKHIHTDYIPDVQQGEVVGFYTLVIDQTDQLQAREQVQHLNEELAAINEELTAANEELHESNARLMRTNADLDTFVYTASHDLKSPITNIEGLLIMLREVLPAAVQQDELVAQMLTLLNDTVGRFRRTITQLTDLVRLQQSQQGPAELVELQPLLDAVSRDLNGEIRAAGATVHLDLPPGSWVSFAPANLRSIVYNLLSNAVKYRAPERAAQVWVQAERLAGGAVVLRVRDNGLGLDATQQGRLFQVFQRLHTHVEGTGVGLYMIKRLIENGGGQITVASQPGVGTTFTVTFRAA